MMITTELRDSHPNLADLVELDAPTLVRCDGCPAFSPDEEMVRRGRRVLCPGCDAQEYVEWWENTVRDEVTFRRSKQ